MHTAPPIPVPIAASTILPLKLVDEVMVSVSVVVADPKERVPLPEPKEPTVILFPFVAKVQLAGMVKEEGVKTKVPVPVPVFIMVTVPVPVPTAIAPVKVSVAPVAKLNAVPVPPLKIQALGILKVLEVDKVPPFPVIVLAVAPKFPVLLITKVPEVNFKPPVNELGVNPEKVTVLLAPASMSTAAPLEFPLEIAPEKVVVPLSLSNPGVTA